MRFSKKLLNFLNSLVTIIITLTLCIIGAYSGYALWDNKHIYDSVDDIQIELQKIKPSVSADGDNSESFEELRLINPDVCAWLTLYGTNIDYPILQGKNNLSYINTDVYGNFALAGSLFLDTRNSSTFDDSFSLIYGHHMDEHKMFGDLDFYSDRSFFENNSTGVLILPDKIYSLDVIATLEVPSSEPVVFDPEQSGEDISELLNYMENNAVLIHNDTLNKAKSDSNVQLLALSTCSSEFSEARTVVIALMKPFI